MPRLIRTPEAIFRQERRDVYSLEFLQDNGPAIKATWQEMEEWFAQHLPQSRIERLAPSEHSGWIMGGPAVFSIAFTEADLAAFCAQWERADGASLDPRFQLYVRRYSDWWERRGRHMPTLSRPEHPGVSVWIETPLGIMTHLLTDEEQDRHPSRAEDIWANACQQWPELQSLQLEDLRYGEVARGYKGEPPWVLLWNAPYMLLASNRSEDIWQDIVEWLRLPEGTHVTSEI